MKILYLLNAYEEDGPGLLICRLASIISRKQDVEVSSAAISRGGDLKEKFDRAGIPTRVFGMKNALDAKNYLRLKKFLKREKFDVVHTNILRADIFGKLAAHSAGTPVIISTEHGIHAWEHRGPLVRKAVKWFYLKTVKYSSGIICVSDHVKNALLREGVPENKLHRIYNGVDTDLFVPTTGDERDKLRSFITDQPVDYTVGLVGNLVEIKGIQYFMESLPQIFRKIPRLLVVVVGEGPLKDELRNETIEMGISDRVKFLGRLSSITSKIMSSLDVLVQPSLTESFGLAAAEALSCQVPVVASNVGGLAELIEDGVCGFLVPPRRPKALAEKVIEIIDDPIKRLQLGEQGRKRILAKFNINKTAEDYLILYEDLLEAAS